MLALGSRENSTVKSSSVGAWSPWFPGRLDGPQRICFQMHPFFVQVECLWGSRRVRMSVSMCACMSVWCHPSVSLENSPVPACSRATLTCSLGPLTTG